MTELKTLLKDALAAGAATVGDEAASVLVNPALDAPRRLPRYPRALAIAVAAAMMLAFGLTALSG